MLIKPKPGARLSENDPVCAVKTTADLEDKNYSPFEKRSTPTGKALESRFKPLLGHCHDKDPRIPQMDEEVRPIPVDQRDGKGGPVWTKK